VKAECHGTLPLLHSCIVGASISHLLRCSVLAQELFKTKLGRVQHGIDVTQQPAALLRRLADFFKELAGSHLPLLFGHHPANSLLQRMERAESTQSPENDAKRVKSHLAA